jgi:hypothetical protein
MRVRRIPARDRIDPMSAHPLSLLFALVGAPIYHCNACRHQYHDWRDVSGTTTSERTIVDDLELGHGAVDAGPDMSDSRKALADAGSLHEPSER